MLGDTAVAVNPEDERYLNLAAENVILPLMDRVIPIIRDPYVDMSFGTGALKITPAHDPNDFDIGEKHKLPSIKVIGDDGFMTAEAGRFQGMDRFACRTAVVEALQEKGLVEKIEPHPHSVGHCYRCKTIVEPNLSRQWFVKAKPLAEKAIQAVDTGKTRIIPETWKKTYYEWMYNIKDWCISRQIWWGHQIPAWTCEDCEKIAVAHGGAGHLPVLRKQPAGKRNRCSGHLVQFGPLALLHHGLAGADPPPENILPHFGPDNRFRYSLFLGSPG